MRNLLRRSWQWAQSECRRKRKLQELAILLLLGNVVFLYCIMASVLQERDRFLENGEHTKVGKYVLLHATPSNASHRLRTPDRFNQIINLTYNFHNNIRNKFSLYRYGKIPDSDNKSSGTDPTFSILDISPETVTLQNSSLTDSSESEQEVAVDFDPILGRGFQDEFVTHKSDGNGFLLFETKSTNLNSINEISDLILEDKNILKTDRNRTHFIKDDLLSSDKKEIETKDNSQSFLFAPKYYKYKYHNISNPDNFTLKNDKKVYFVDIGNLTCFIHGTDIEKTKQTMTKICLCLKYYHGSDCGIPDAVWNSRYFHKLDLKRRKIARRVINGLPVNHEFAMFEARLHELHDVVDVFLIAESNYTAHGDPKKLEFFRKFQDGYLAEFQDKILYIKLGFFSKQSKKDGWLADSYIRFYMGLKGLKRIQNYRDDDLFVLSDADEIPSREVITFLKLYDGYPEPIGFGLRWNIFNFYWQKPAEASFKNWLSGTKEAMTTVTAVATVGMVKKVLLGNVFFVRKEGAWAHPDLSTKLKKYRMEGNTVRDWVIGSIGHYAGWHCSWCFSPANIVSKMDSAQANDKPRWGDFPEKKNITYITSRLWQGRWFDDKLQLIPTRIQLGDRFYAPPYFQEHPETYRSILFHPSHPLNINSSWSPP